MRFLIRVELHNTPLDHPNYSQLHLLMLRAKYSKVLVADNGKKWQLPRAEYTCNGNSIETVLTHVKTIANKVDTANGVVVTEFTQMVWDGLKPAPNLKALVEAVQRARGFIKGNEETTQRVSRCRQYRRNAVG